MLSILDTTLDMLPILDTISNPSRESGIEGRMVADIEEGNIEPGNIQAVLDAPRKYSSR
jgi:hypothetical protein